MLSQFIEYNWKKAALKFKDLFLQGKKVIKENKPEFTVRQNICLEDFFFKDMM